MLLTEKYAHHHFILASKSPRRKLLFDGLNLSFSQTSIECDETLPETIFYKEAASYLATRKAQAYLLQNELDEHTFLITADTVVVSENRILGKPHDETEAYHYLKSLSGKSHEVITGVAITNAEKSYSFDDTTTVYFKDLSDDEIYYYIQQFHPFDKAGAYGIQEWIGYIGITKIEGSYFNVMGLPIQKLATALLNWNL